MGGRALCRADPRVHLPPGRRPCAVLVPGRTVPHPTVQRTVAQVVRGRPRGQRTHGRPGQLARRRRRVLGVRLPSGVCGGLRTGAPQASRVHRPARPDRRSADGELSHYRPRPADHVQHTRHPAAFMGEANLLDGVIAGVTEDAIVVTTVSGGHRIPHAPAVSAGSGRTRAVSLFSCPSTFRSAWRQRTGSSSAKWRFRTFRSPEPTAAVTSHRINRRTEHRSPRTCPGRNESNRATALRPAWHRNMRFF